MLRSRLAVCSVHARIPSSFQSQVHIDYCGFQCMYNSAANTHTHTHTHEQHVAIYMYCIYIYIIPTPLACILAGGGSKTKFTFFLGGRSPLKCRLRYPKVSDFIFFGGGPPPKKMKYRTLKVSKLHFLHPPPTAWKVFVAEMIVI